MSQSPRKSNKIWRVIDILKWGEKYFTDNNFDNPRKEIEILVQEVLNCRRVDLYLRFDEPLTTNLLNTLREWVTRRKNREPSQYITGKVSFYNINLYITKDVLIPRPESEILIDSALQFCAKNSQLSILDIGTGSGCLALSMAKELPIAKVVGIDNSEKAIELAKRNATKLDIQNAEFKLIDILKEKIDNKYDLVISNPPYIPKTEMSTLMHDVINFEPHSALTDNSDGLTFYRKFIEISNLIMNINGWIFLEVGKGEHPKKVSELFNNNEFANVELIKDFNGDDRVLKAQLA